MPDFPRPIHAQPGSASSGDLPAVARSRPSGPRRFAAALVPAAAVTAGLFVVMNGLIQVDEIQLVQTEPRPLPILTPQKVKPDEIGVRVRPKPLDAAVPPPPRPRATATKGTINLPPVTLAGNAPSLPKATRFVDFMTGPVTIANRTATPVRPPVLSYPAKALERGLEGDCKVYFNVSMRGEPFDVRPVCSDPVFDREAKRAVSRSKFLPKVQNGQSVELSDVMYPLSFRLED